MVPEEGHRLTILVGESDKHEHVPLHDWILRKAKERGLAGATVIRGVAGFGAHSTIHTAKILDLSVDLPMIIEVIDKLDKLEPFLAEVGGAIKEGVATLEPVKIYLYRSGQVH